jgi:transposase
VQERNAARNRVQKLLESVNVKLSSVATDIFGKSGRAMLRAIGTGLDSPEALAELALGQLRKKLEPLRFALNGRMDETSRFILLRMLAHLDDLDRDIANVEDKIDEKLSEFSKQRELLCAIPGVSLTVSAAVIAEVGVDMKVFGTHQRLAAWAGVCPSNNESAGKQLGSRKRHGNVYLATTLVEAAQSAVRTKGSYYRDKFFRLKARRGYRRALVAIAHKILIAIFNILSTGRPYKELGNTYLDALDKDRTVRNLVRRLERLGHAVQLSHTATPPTPQLQTFP